jgi:hypothetical protein
MAYLGISHVLLCRKIVIYNRTTDDGFYYSKERSATFTVRYNQFKKRRQNKDDL